MAEVIPVVPERSPDGKQESGGSLTGSLPFPLKIAVSAVVGLLAIGLILLFSLYKGIKTDLLEESRLRESAQMRSEAQAAELGQNRIRIESLESLLKLTGEARDAALVEAAGLKTDNALLGTRLEASEARLAELRLRLEAEETALAAVRTKLEEEREGQKLLFSKIERLMQEREELREKLAAGAGAVQMPDMVVTESGPAGGVIGEVLAVNERYDFVVINLGREEGIASGAKFRILDHGMAIADAVARRILDRMTIADLVNRQSSRRIKKNFQAVLQR